MTAGRRSARSRATSMPARSSATSEKAEIERDHRRGGVRPEGADERCEQRPDRQLTRPEQPRGAPGDVGVVGHRECGCVRRDEADRRDDEQEAGDHPAHAEVGELRDDEHEGAERRLDDADQQQRSRPRRPTRCAPS